MGYYNRAALDAPVYLTAKDSAAAGAQVDGYFFTSDGYYEVDYAGCTYDVAGGASAAVQLRKCASGTTIASGTALLTTAFDLTAAADTPQRKSVAAGTMTTTVADRQLIPGDSLALDFSGTLTGLLGVGVTVRLRRTRHGGNF
jgi:hypothetical protein